MKTLGFVVILLLASAVSAAPTLTWDPSAGAEGYKMYCGAVPVITTPTPIDVGSVTSYDIAALVSPGIQSECWVTAYAAGVSDSADSNHVRLTPPTAVQTIVVPGQPSSVTIQWQ